jgi:hypothetical protein
MIRRVGYGDGKTSDTAQSRSWDSILETGERILWSGRPDPSLTFAKKKNIPLAIFGCVFAGFALFWMIAASMAGGFFWMFGLLHFSIGLALIYFALWGNGFMRNRTQYALTRERAIIATDIPIIGRRFKSYPITEDTKLDYRDETPPSVYFAQVTRRGKNSTYTVDVGFERISDGHDVYETLQKIQRGYL